MTENIRLPKLVKSELQFYIDNCNFSDEELEYFNYKVKDKSNQYIANTMNISIAKVSYIARKVKDKMLKVIN